MIEPRLRSISRRPCFLTVLALSGLLASCGTSSGSFIKMHPTYSVAKGEVVRIENMNSNEVEALSDGRAVTVSRPGCRVTLAFDEERSKVFNVDQGTILVHGKKHDFLLLPNKGVRERDPENEQAPIAPVEEESEEAQEY